MNSSAQRLNAPIGSFTRAPSRLAKRGVSSAIIVFHSGRDAGVLGSPALVSFGAWLASASLAKPSTIGFALISFTSRKATQPITAVRAALNTIFFIFP